MDLPADLRGALDAAVGGAPAAPLAAAVAGLVARYRGEVPGPGAAPEAEVAAPILARPVDVTAYAAYRMPATYVAVRAALAQTAQAVRTWAPRRLLDLGGGTGAASWAATDVFASLAEVTVLDQVPAALEFGARLAAARPVLRGARWERWTYGTADAGLPTADLVTLSYVIGELTEPTRAALVAAAARTSPAVVVVEPGTPAGYRRVLAARDALVAAGLRIVAPCPHDLGCPLAATTDWCHFAARVNRSGLHRRLKGATLGYEDEKFSYVAAVRDPGPVPHPARVLRHPVQRKGLVQLRLCLPVSEHGPSVGSESGRAQPWVGRESGRAQPWVGSESGRAQPGVGCESGRAQPGVGCETVSRRQGDRYRAARDIAWGDAWPPAT